MAVRSGPFSQFLLATAFLTRLPVGAPRPPESGALAGAGWAFPMVGAGIGALAGLAFLVAELVGCGSAVAALLALTAGIALTGALHEDGLADTADGLGGGASREDKLRIMRDSRHGSFALIALFLSLGLRAAALATLAEPIEAGLALIAAHASSRGGLPWVMHRLPPARPDGLGAAAGRPSLAVALIALGIGGVIALGMLGPVRGVIALIVGGAAVAIVGIVARRQIGGYTGDVLGACQQIGEIVMLVVAAAR